MKGGTDTDMRTRIGTARELCFSSTEDLCNTKHNSRLTKN